MPRVLRQTSEIYGHMLKQIQKIQADPTENYYPIQLKPKLEVKQELKKETEDPE
jgi:hypothetical protein